jgi:hypothetical protein
MKFWCFLIAGFVLTSWVCGVESGAISVRDGIQERRDGLSLFLTNGILQPASVHQRYRRNEYAINQPFYQWWFFAVKDLKNDRHFSFSYIMLDCVSNLRNEASSVTFSMTAEDQKTGFTKNEAFPLDWLEVQNHFDLSLDANPEDDLIEYTLEVINDDTYRIRGRMQVPPDSTDAKVVVDGKLQGEPAGPGIFVEWDLTIYRIYGWYAQESLEPLAQRWLGSIGWNTYAHSSEVEGTIMVGDNTYHFERGVDARAYCDQNWGKKLPRGFPREDSIDYPWGWFYVGLPSTDPAEELSIIAGMGRYHTLVSGISEGLFADIRLDQTTHIEVAKLEPYKRSPDKPGVVSSSTNDEKVIDFHVDQNQWTKYTDSYGTNLVPMHQKVWIETKHYQVTLDFFSKPEDYNRLPIFDEDYDFGDFEALGVDVHVVINYKWTTHSYYEWDKWKLFPPYNTQHHVKQLYDFWSDDGGLEYGYNLD